MVLYPSGDWRLIPMAGRTIPGTPESEKTNSKNVAAAASSNQGNQPENQTREPSSAVAPSTETDTSEYVYHTIKSGDTLGKLAAKYHTTVKALCNLNGINERTVLRIGKKLRVK